MQVLARSRAHSNHTEMMSVHLLLLLTMGVCLGTEGGLAGLSTTVLYVYGALFFVMKTLHTIALLQKDSYKKVHIFRPAGYLGAIGVMLAMCVHLTVFCVANAA
ncbi:unnamed protein product [Vitrella brassicaformis CCMP3155]|uniref:Uncharacterized protein n=2 Tax=Vitrella brassicaformis TaxID=1169539 RepID=A0A0G4EGL7_VITBC|nr:unnamed protein product [Vitrella brassicaformis CCMP3155]|mmetsp:Transcript_31804/g.78888  ORF Transcript_31804/g.78888 Transcript_31804/m.78888 type:complete len:104 (+) Transcript_31804:293-604(+)|eukprot:CEL95387.1 unnamed protein product [Vitrella brassicaformis CCMP3155]